MLDYKKILVPVDLHEEAKYEQQIETAISLAEKFGAELTFVNVIDVDLDSSMLQRYEEVRSDFAITARKQLRDILEQYLPNGMNAEVMVLSGRSYSKVLDAAKDLQADLIVVMAHKPGMKDFLLGMTAARVVRHASSSVLVVREREKT